MGKVQNFGKKDLFFLYFVKLAD